MGSKNSLTLCNRWILGHETHRSFVPDVKGCLSVKFPACSVCQKLGEYQRMPIKATQCGISCEGEDRPSDNSNDGEWWPDEVDLNAVTIGNMSIDSKPVATEGKRGRYREITVDFGCRRISCESRRLAKCRFETVNRLSERTTIRGTWRRKG